MTTFRSKFLVLAAVAGLSALMGYAASGLASSAQPSVERMALARQYIASVPVEDEIKAAIEQLAQNIQPDQRVLFRSLADKSIDYGRLRSAAELATAEIFTESEIKAMMAFFGSPDGKAIRAKLPQYEARIQPVLNEVLQQFVMELQKNNVTLAPAETPQ